MCVCPGFLSLLWFSPCLGIFLFYQCAETGKAKRWEVRGVWKSVTGTRNGGGSAGPPLQSRTSQTNQDSFHKSAVPPVWELPVSLTIVLLSLERSQSPDTMQPEVKAEGGDGAQIMTIIMTTTKTCTVTQRLRAGRKWDFCMLLVEAFLRPLGASLPLMNCVNTWTEEHIIILLAAAVYCTAFAQHFHVHWCVWG